MPTIVYLLLGFVVGAGLGFLLGLLRKRPDVSEPLQALERRLADSFGKANADMAARVETIKGDLRADLGERVQKGLGEVRETVDRQLADGREEQSRRLSQTVSSLEEKFLALQSATETKLGDFADRQGTALKTSHTELTGAVLKLSESNDRKLEDVRKAVEDKLAKIQADNSTQLEQMRRTVDEKLQGTLEKRLGESFKLVSERLELVHKGLGEMQTLANGVGDLKKVLTNVKARGTWGEMQLGNLLEQVLTPEQYAQNVPTKFGSGDRVEFAIRLPGRDAKRDATVWLPIDAKFPKEDYERLVAAAEKADATMVELASAQLEARIKSEAKMIRDKYIDPPHTTDFGILYLPVEGLYAEVLRRPGLIDTLQRDFRVTIAGPTVLTALLNSLQMGFRTLAIEKRSSEVWVVLGAIKTEFSRFGEIIGRVQKKLQEASNVIDSAATRTRVIEKKLRDVQELPAAESRTLLGEPEPTLLDNDNENEGK